MAAVRVVVVAAALVVNSAEVRGDSAPGEAAREALVQARQASDAGRLPEAIEAYKRAYELSGDLSLLFQLGEVNRRLGQDVAAIRFYRSYLARDPRGKYREAAERAARALELQPSKPAPAAAVAPPAPPVAPAPPAPARVRVAPAPVPRARARRAGTCSSRARARARRTGTRCARACSRRHRHPLRPRLFASRRHRFPSWRRRHLSHPPPAIAPEPATPPAVDLRADVTATPEPRPRTPLPTSLSWAGLGATIALGAGAIVTGVQANRRYDQLKASCGRTTEGCSTSDIDQVKSSALTANLLWAATGVGAVATGVIVFVNAREAGFAGAWSF